MQQNGRTLGLVHRSAALHIVDINPEDLHERHGREATADFDHQSWTSGRRSRFTSERRRFWAILRSTAAFVGRVGRRGRGGGAIAAVRTSTSRPSAASRFRSCERCSDATTVRTPSTSRPARRSSARARRDGPKAEELAMSKSNSTRESVVFTACPPGPDERENRQTSSDSGITLERTRSGPDTRQECPLTRQPRSGPLKDPLVPPLSHLPSWPKNRAGARSAPICCMIAG